MAQTVFLSETIIYGELGSSRYMGPYVLASQLESQGFSTVVIDYFTKIPNFFEYLENFIGEETLFVGLASTFLTPDSPYFGKYRNRKEATDTYRAGVLWFEEQETWFDWINQLKTVLKRKAPFAKIVIGGTKAAHFLQNPEAAKDVDYFIFAAADQSIVSLAQALYNGREPEYKVQNKIKVLANVALKHQVELCPVTHYQPHWAIQRNESLPFEISRGCLFNCKFCSYDRKSSIKKSPENIVAELMRNYELFGTTVYHFCDDCFNESRQKVESICEAILKLPFKIEWVSFARVDVSVKFPETMDLMVESGATSLFWGIESFHTVAARNAGKGTPPEKIKEFLIEAKRKHGENCFMYGSFITGLPGEPEDSVIETVEWLKSNDALHAVGFGPLILNPYNESLDQTAIDYADYSRNPEKYGFTKVSSDFSYWGHEHMSSTRAEELARWAHQEWLQAKGNGLFAYGWQYMHFRTLGYSKREIFSRFRNNENKFELAKEVAELNQKFMEKYWADLKDQNTRS